MLGKGRRAGTGVMGGNETLRIVSIVDNKGGKIWDFV